MKNFVWALCLWLVERSRENPFIFVSNSRKKKYKQRSQRRNRTLRKSTDDPINVCVVFVYELHAFSCM